MQSTAGSWLVNKVRYFFCNLIRCIPYCLLCLLVVSGLQLLFISAWSVFVLFATSWPAALCCRCIDVYQAPSLKLLCSIQQHHKIINTLRWHHDHSSALELHCLLASGSSNAIVYVHDLRSVIGESSLTCSMSTELYCNPHYVNLEESKLSVKSE